MSYWVSLVLPTPANGFSGGGLVIGLSAGLLAPVIGAGLGAAFTTIGITGTTGFLAGAGGAAVITTGGVLTGSGIAAKGMAKRTQYVRTFDLLPLHNNKRVNCILTVPGYVPILTDESEVLIILQFHEWKAGRRATTVQRT